MSTLYVPIYRTEAGVHANPAVSDLYTTNCDGGLEGSLKKNFQEVLIHWNGSAWVEDPVFLPGQSIVALKVENVCTGNYAYINYKYSDFRLAQLCCFTEEAPVEGLFEEEFEEEFQ